MIHSVKDFVDKKMNNKLICFTNIGMPASPFNRAFEQE